MFKELNHKTFLVGGAVRNLLMGKDPKDLDYVFENTTEEEVLSIFPDAQKVGKDFPVFIINGHECALARQEKSTGDGYSDFEFSIGVSIEEDLSRRDLTINAVAKHYVTGEIIDPHNGISDIRNRVIRTHNEKAFLEDSLRIIRAIRFSCEFDFTIEEHTLELMKEAVDKLICIPVERIQSELQKVYERCDKPSNFFRLLDSIGGLGIHFKELEDAKNVITGSPQYHPEIYNSEHIYNSFDYAKSQGYSYSIAIAALLHDIGKNMTPKELQPHHYYHENRIEVLDAFFERHKFDSHCMKLASIVFRYHMKWHNFLIMKDMKKIRFVRNIPRYLREEFVQACNCDARLSNESLECFKKVCEAIDTAKIEVPKDILKKGKEEKHIIVDYVNNIILKRLKEIKN